VHELGEAGKLLNIQIHDHIIIGSGSGAFVSLAERGEC
jgi:DNA repair protein RadC